MPSIADMDQDGAPEVIALGAVLDGATGATKATFAAQFSVFASDVDMDGLLEVVGPRYVFDADGTQVADVGIDGEHAAADDWKEYDEEGWNVDVSSVPEASRFSARPDTGFQPHLTLRRSDMNDNDELDLRRKLAFADFWCRVLTHYPQLRDQPAPQVVRIDDIETGKTIHGYLLNPAYAGDKDVAMAFETLLESKPPQDCEAVVREESVSFEFGLRDGKIYQQVTSDR